ncbi:MAG: PD40 domain-containing protein [Chloroflexi bacterium]|nr:PD40 domain-containing protein [Chloroflexota bacterium]
MFSIAASARTAPLPQAGGGSGRLAYSSGTFADNIGIYSANADGTDQARLSPAYFAFDAQPAWSPNGKRIAFHSRRIFNKLEIYVMDADGSGVERLTDNEFDDASPSWSPDGSRIAFDSARNGNLDIYVMDADGSHQHRLTFDAARDEFPSWSPDGTKIAFQSNRSGNYEIYVMNADGSDAVNVTNTPADDITPDWSPDGREIAYATSSDESYEIYRSYDIYKMRADGSRQTRLSGNAGRHSGPDWSPDGSVIAFSSPVRGNGDIWIMDADGANKRELIGGGEPEEFPDWAPPRCTVSSVLDGDTFTCTDGAVVNMLQIDAPELEACGGDWARAALSNIFLAPGTEVVLSFDKVPASDSVLAAPIVRGTDGVDYNLSIVMVYVGLAKAAVVGTGNTKFLDWAMASETWARVAQWNMWAPGKPFTGGC